MTEITLNVYDMLSLNTFFRFCGVGAYHTSIVIHDKFEYYYGNGVLKAIKVGTIGEGINGVFYKTYKIGTTSLSINDCKEIIKSFKHDPKWTMEKYNMLYHNCNSFTRKLCKTLVGIGYLKKYPGWINRGENIIKWIFATSCAPMISFMPQVYGFYREGYGDYDMPYIVDNDESINIENTNDNHSNEITEYIQSECTSV